MEIKQIKIMPGYMTLKSSLLGEILEKLASLRMNITIRGAFIDFCGVFRKSAVSLEVVNLH